jgi:predicted nucleic acid-binding protein
MPTGKKIFIDTNVLLYANMANSPFCQDARNALQALPNDYDSFWINRQVIREYLKVMSLEMKNAGKVDYAALRREITDYLRIVHVAETSDATTAHLLTLIETTSTSGKQVYDTNIVTTMLANGVDFLLTHNVADFKRFGHLITVVQLVVP